MAVYLSEGRMGGGSLQRCMVHDLSQNVTFIKVREVCHELYNML